MKNIIHVLFSLCFLVGGIGICLAGNPTLKYLGTAFFKIKTSEGKVIYIDPYAVSDPDSADAVLITHEHSDHNELFRVIRKPTCQVIRVANALIGTVYQSFTLGNIKIKAVPAYDYTWHPNLTGVGFVVEFDSIKIYHAGGTTNIPEMANLAAEKINYALFPINSSPEDLTQAAALVQAKHDIPMHTNDPAFNARFTSPHRLIMLINETINLTADTTLHAARLLRVPQEFPTIQAAIDSAQNSDTVLVGEGMYLENIRYKGKGIVVTSRYYITKDWQTVRNTIIDGSTAADKNYASTVQFLNAEDSTAVLDGFTIKGGSGTKYFAQIYWQEGGGIIMGISSAIIRNNIIRNNITQPLAGTTNGGGGGISSFYGNPTIYNNEIVSNTAGYAGGIVLNWSKGVIKNNLIYSNTAGRSEGGGGIVLWQSPQNSGIVENNTIVGNISTTNGGGISISVNGASTYPVVRNNIIWGNRQATGGQITNPQYITGYNDIENYSSGTNISTFPKLLEESFLLSPTSPCIDSGDPVVGYNDVLDPSNPGMALMPSRGSLRNDIGATGGPFAKILSSLEVNDFRLSNSSISVFCYTGQTTSAGVELLNTGSISITIDSVTHTDASHFFLNKDFTGQVLDLFQSDSIKINFRPLVSGIFYDTIKVFHHVAGKTSPIKIIVGGAASDYTLTPNVTNGTVTMNPPGGAYSYGTSVTVALTAANGYRFMKWTGDVPVGHETDNPLILTMDANKTITADLANTCIITANAGWNLVSVPLLQANSSADVVFPHKFGDMYMFSSANQTYFTTETLANGLGYWIYYQNPDTSSMCGYSTGPMTVPAYKAGWVLIGSRQTSLAMNELQVSDGMIYGDAFRYNHSSNSYDLTTMINPGEAAWIYVTKACTITIP